MAMNDALSSLVDSAKDLLTGANQSDGETDPTEADALELLKADHRRVEALFKEVLAEKKSTLVAQRKNIATILAELALHAKIEETILYPAVYGKTKRDTDERLEVLEAFEEHGSMKDLMKKISRADGRDESLKAKVQVLSEITEHHVKEEESTFFPEARKLLGEKRLAAIGKEIQKIKARAIKRMKPASRTAAKRKPSSAKSRR